jgi:hypothetical protein
MGFVALLCAASAGWEGCACEIAVVTDERECSLDAVSDVGWAWLVVHGHRSWLHVRMSHIAPVTSMLTIGLSSCLMSSGPTAPCDCHDVAEKLMIHTSAYTDETDHSRRHLTR